MGRQALALTTDTTSYLKKKKKVRPAGITLLTYKVVHTKEVLELLGYLIELALDALPSPARCAALMHLHNQPIQAHQWFTYSSHYYH